MGLQDKLKTNGIIDRYKAQLMVRDFNQVVGIDYFDCSSLVVNFVIVYSFLTVASSNHGLFVNWI